MASRSSGGTSLTVPLRVWSSGRGKGAPSTKGQEPEIRSGSEGKPSDEVLGDYVLVTKLTGYGALLLASLAVAMALLLAALRRAPLEATQPDNFQGILRCMIAHATAYSYDIVIMDRCRRRRRR